MNQLIIDERNNMTEEKYNGWTNRETWLVNLWFDNLDDLIDFDILAENCKNREEAIEEVADAIRAFIEQDPDRPEFIDSSFWTDLYTSDKSLDKINWLELAEYLIPEDFKLE